jgi:hypothetical protein
VPEVDLESGIRQTIGWYRGQGQLPSERHLQPA